ncbi:phosphoribosylglycinamide formyltransferase [Candidatus Venteria ishoeyi]|uniref:Phosphoribosylglycinamide formyltransferase n=1 Tax=Candidatus Venteria ishoeyi TaxID=1899563 RepID=A0A1H6FF67_9GAMM|nr:phosphoribosylglycinamide formyltransferase [Candidatus Venteria ishoeyi]MDM8545596.1 phosphoribosylglycinamide formyltransferase [Candidatus Venteria ishoeyi]SEH07654.1 Phosphoribosylglycinamide formyltransferase [Candidatus Venteria ishoeyi]
MMGHQLPLSVVILISGRGSNMVSIIADAEKADAPYKVLGVLSNRPQAAGLQHAKVAGIATAVLDHTQYASRAEFDEALAERIECWNPDLVVLAGFMRILSPGFVNRYAGRLINIHPSLLPAFQGLDTHRRALEAGVTEHGATVHFVTEELDAGPVILQAHVPVYQNDTEQLLATRVLEQEHVLYPRAIRHLAASKV